MMKYSSLFGVNVVSWFRRLVPRRETRANVVRDIVLEKRASFADVKQKPSKRIEVPNDDEHNLRA